MRKFLSLLLTMAMVLSLAVTVNAAAPKEDITILHTNDVHCDYEKYAKVATLHKSADLLVDAGDHVQGGVIGTLSKGEYIVDIMNYLKYDAAVPGNHEFDYGMDQFLHIAKDLAKYPYISANFTGKDGKPYFDAYKMFEVKGVKVAFVGVCTPETFTNSRMPTAITSMASARATTALTSTMRCRRPSMRLRPRAPIMSSASAISASTSSPLPG